ncbi:MAG: hypothetical protein IME99_01520 [Proteobacteria bacterium]|nr:hypothetical protein [Pseudomonadota bacterium]
MKKILIAFFAVAFAALLSTPAEAIVQVEGRYWFSTLDSNVKATGGGVGTDIDLVNTLGMDEKSNFFDGRVVLELGGHSLRYGYVPLSWKGTGSDSLAIVFNGQTYTANVAIDSELTLDYHRLAYQYNFIDTLDNHLGVIAELKYFNIDAKLESAVRDETISFGAPVPTVGLSAQVAIPFLIKLNGEATGISLGDKAYMYDAEISLSYKPLPFFDLAGGYRVFKLHVEDGNDEADIEVNGPFIMLRADF